jgi:hypothetical protein
MLRRTAHGSEATVLAMADVECMARCHPRRRREPAIHNHHGCGVRIPGPCAALAFRMARKVFACAIVAIE